MLPKNPSNKLETHEVFNVPSYLGDQDLWENDGALKDWTNILGGGWAVEKLKTIGKSVGSQKVFDNADKVCPVFPGKVERTHWSIKDPFKGWGSDPDDLVNFRKTREDLTARIKNLIKSRFA